MKSNILTIAFILLAFVVAPVQALGSVGWHPDDSVELSILPVNDAPAAVLADVLAVHEVTTNSAPVLMAHIPQAIKTTPTPGQVASTAIGHRDRVPI
jgi:hypothetical protein